MTRRTFLTSTSILAAICFGFLVGQNAKLNPIGVSRPIAEQKLDAQHHPRSRPSPCKKKGLKCRIISRDGKTISVSRKIEKSRLNFIIENNKVIRLIRG